MSSSTKNFRKFQIPSGVVQLVIRKVRAGETHMGPLHTSRLGPLDRMIVSSPLCQTPGSSTPRPDQTYRGALWFIKDGFIYIYIYNIHGHMAYLITRNSG